MDDNGFVTQKEFDQFRLETAHSLAEITKSQAVSAAKMDQVPADLRQLAAEIRALREKPAPQADQNALQLSNLADAIRNQPRPQPLAEVLSQIPKGGTWQGPAFGGSAVLVVILGYLQFFSP